MKIVADRVNCHFRAKFEDRSLQCLRNSGFRMGQKRQFFHRESAATRTIYTVQFHLKINFHTSIGQPLNTSCTVMMRIDRTMKTFGTAKFLPFQTLNLQNIEKNGVEIQQFPVYGMQDWSTLCSSMFGVQTKT